MKEKRLAFRQIAKAKIVVARRALLAALRVRWGDDTRPRRDGVACTRANCWFSGKERKKGNGDEKNQQGVSSMSQ